jgi:hypothetical protein
VCHSVFTNVTNYEYVQVIFMDITDSVLNNASCSVLIYLCLFSDSVCAVSVIQRTLKGLT